MPNQKGKLLAGFVLLVFMTSCSEGWVYSEYSPLTNGDWPMNQTLEFRFDEKQVDTIYPHNIFINIRNDENFAFSNLFLITEFEFPDGQTLRDTLEYEMAAPDGKWLGKGVGSIKESKLWFKQNIVFPESGVYTMNISHAMRKNGQVEGLSVLEGITDVGLQIEKNSQ